MAAPGRAAFRIPAALAFIVQVPALIALGALFLGESIRLIYGYEDMFLGVWMAYAAAPAALVDSLFLAGRLTWVDELPDPTRREAPAPATLSLPGEAAPGAMRPAEKPLAARLGRRPADGVLFAFGLAALGLAGVLMLAEQQSFDSVLGVKLGGIWFRGTYWNRWWFVFYGLLAAAGSSLTASAALFIRRLNRREE